MLRLTLMNIVTKIPTARSALSAIATRSHAIDSTAAEVKEKAEENIDVADQETKKTESERLAEFRKKLKEDMASDELNKYNFTVPIENDPLPPWPNNVNPHTGEVGGPRGPEPTRYGDWERKGICIDF